MYIGYIEDRKSMGYDVLLDTSCGIKLVSITNSILLLIRNLPSNENHTTKRIIIVIALVSGVCFSNLESAEAIGLSMPPAPVVRVYPSYEHPSEVKIAPTVNPRLDKIYFMPNKEMIPLIYLNAKNVYFNERVLKRLRAGGFEETLVLMAIGVIVFLTFQLSGTDAFAILEQFGKLNAPTTNPGFGPTVASTEIGLVPTQAQEFNDMSLKFNEPKPNFVMTQNEDLKLIKETYPGQLEITGNERISDWQAAKKIYHASDFGINPEDYGMTKEQLRKIEKVGLTKYVRFGNPLPSVELIKDYQAALKGFCENSEKLPSGTYSSRGDQKVHKSSFYYNEETRKIVAFNMETQDLITAR